MAKFMAEKGISLLKLAEERAELKKELEEEKRKLKQSLIPYIPNGCISNILLRLPLESLQRTRFVCKMWYKIINSRNFIDVHLRSSESVIIFLVPAIKGAFFHYDNSVLQTNLDAFSVESKLFQLQSVPFLGRSLLDQSSLFCMKFMEIRGGKIKMGDYKTTCLGNIRASCYGLIILDNVMKKGGLIVMNPVTRELSRLPLGTLYPPNDESYGLAYCQNIGKFKLVHLFRDEMQFIGCEILILGDNSWKMVDGPGFGLLGWFGYDPIFAIGAIHWVPHIDHSDYIVSMAVDDDKFRVIQLPKSCRTCDRIVEIGGNLGFVVHDEVNQTDVWILRDLDGEGWTKKFSIGEGYLGDMTPLYFSRISCEIIFKDKDGQLYAYDCGLHLMRKVEMKQVGFPADGWFLPHVNSLISWRMPVDDDSVQNILSL
ncbi:hypothetical protein M9H77_18016 [Catharanthus roseus]|uniref:Uncharacterized protein n=1 Tax=Catharanthus roseus TaxID=4058 RepID=A0ACC0B696_CATRO|nr:hypothetical protein M9H77_18016 [Catharanthus roseus]